MMDDWISKQRFEDTTCCTTSTAPFPVPTRYYYYDGGQVTCALKQLRTRWFSFKYFFLFNLTWGRWTQFDEHMFSNGLVKNHQLEKHPRNIHTNNERKKTPVTNNCPVRRQEAALAESTEPEAVFWGWNSMGGPGAPCVLGNYPPVN